MRGVLVARGDDRPGVAVDGQVGRRRLGGRRARRRPRGGGRPARATVARTVAARRARRAPTPIRRSGDRRGPARRIRVMCPSEASGARWPRSGSPGPTLGGRRHENARAGADVASGGGAIGPVGAAGACHDGPVTRDSRVSRRIASIAESATLAVDAKAKALQAAGEPVVGLRRGRARLPDAPAHRRGRDRGVSQPGEPPVLADGGSARPAAGHRRQDRPRLRLRRDPEPGARHQRRQARRLQHLPDPAGPRRRGPAARALLDHLSRGDRAGRRPGDRAADDRGVRLPGDASTSSRRRAPRTRRSCSSSRRRTRPARCTRRRRSRPSAAGRSSTASGWSPTRSTSTSRSTTTCSPRCPPSSPRSPSGAWC